MIDTGHGERACPICGNWTFEDVDKYAKLEAENAELRAEIERYINAFKHTHVAGRYGNIDWCHKCELDLRDKIHIRSK